MPSAVELKAPVCWQAREEPAHQPHSTVCGARAGRGRDEGGPAGRSTWWPPGGSAVRQGATPVRARCRADGGPEHRLVARQAAGAVRWRRGRRRCTDRSVQRRRGQAHMFDHSCASMWCTGHRGGSASAVCAMAQPWTTVEWAVWPARPHDPTVLSRGRSSAEPTARRSGMAATTPLARKPRERVAHAAELRGRGRCRAGVCRRGYTHVKKTMLR